MRKSTFQFIAVCGLLSTFASGLSTWAITVQPMEIAGLASDLYSNTDADLRKGLIAHYPFSGNTNDASGNGHNATFLGGNFVEDRHGNPNQAYQFTGRNNSLLFAGSKIKSPLKTLTFWTKSRKKTEDILIADVLPGKLTVSVRKVNHKFQMEFTIFNKKTYIRDKTNYPDPDAFNFISILYTGRQIEFWVNNKQAGALLLDQRFLNSFLPHTLKKDPTFSSNAVLDDIRIYSRTLDKSELEVLFAETLNLPELSYETHIKIAADSAQIYRTVLSDGGSPISQMGVCWNTSGNPDTSDNKTSTPGHTGIFKTTMTNLLPNTKYYVKAYAINEAGIGYSQEDFEFITLPDLDYGTLTDIDGNVYKTINIGTQTWMAENLRTTHYADGTPIPDGSSQLNDPGKFYYLFLGDTMHREIYGLLYSWEGAANSSAGQTHLTGTQGACPTGWHIPSYAEKEALLNYLGGSVVAGNKLKEAGTAHWDAPNEATNETGFTALGSGVKAMEEGLYGVFVDYRNLTYFWTSESYSNNAPVNPAYFAPVLQFNGSDSHYWSPAINYGAPVRCIKNNANAYVTIPVINTLPVTGITSTAAVGGGTVESDGGQFRTVRGICWSTSPAPDTADFKTMKLEDQSVFSDSITGLTANTTYYVRAYGITSAGISYGNEVSFSTGAAMAQSGNVATSIQAEKQELEPDFYPNPASSAIQFIRVTEKTTVTIFDSRGKIVKEENILGNTLTVDDLPNGIYYLKIKSNNSTVIKKMIKQ